MLKTNLKSRIGLSMLLASLVCLSGTQATAQTPEEPDPPQVQVPGAPGFISELVNQTALTPEQVEQMRSGGAGWGNIMIATRLAEQIAANSPEEAKLTFEQALRIVLEARAQNKGFGQIAHEHDLKVGRLVGNGNKAAAGPNGNVERVHVREKEKKQNIFGRFFGMLGFGRREKAEKPPKIERAERPERADRPEKPDKPERPDRPERPEKPEKLERPAKPEKPEKPERGPRR